MNLVQWSEHEKVVSTLHNRKFLLVRAARYVNDSYTSANVNFTNCQDEVFEKSDLEPCDYSKQIKELITDDIMNRIAAIDVALNELCSETPK